MKYIVVSIFPISIFIIFVTCGNNRTDVEQNLENSNPGIAEPITDIRVQSARRAAFPVRQIINGKLEADIKTEIKFEASGLLTHLPLYDGKYVNKGDTLAMIDSRELQLQLEQRKNELGNAIIKKNERLILDGGNAYQDTSVPKHKLEIANILSGYNQAEVAIRQTEYLLSKMTVTAPIPGWIADMKLKNFQLVNVGEFLCKIIDPSSFEASFYILENEAVNLSYRTPVVINPISNPEIRIQASVTKINPIVDESGLVNVRARLKRHNARLFEGMNIEVTIENYMPDQIVIPKSALVLRSGREVVFVFDPENNTAIWKYVDVAYENDEALAIAEGLEAGDLVIYEGNLNLDHEAVVELIE